MSLEGKQRPSPTEKEVEPRVSVVGKQRPSPTEKEGMEPKPKKLNVRSMFTSAVLEDTGLVVLPTAQPGPKTAIKFHLKSLQVKPVPTDRIELIDLSGEEEGEEGDQIVKARNLLRSAQERIGKNDILL